MAWRFKASKYKNAAPIVPKPENYVRDICVGSYQTYGNNIAASAKFMAFNWEHTGSSLAVLPLNDSGRKTKLMPLLHGHLDTVTDLDFSPFHDGLLVTGSQDCTVKFWLIPEEGLQESLSEPECMFSQTQRRIETVGFHPTAECLIHCSSFTNITLWDLLSQKEIFSNSDDHTEVIQSVSWKKDGTLLSTSCKDKQVRILDPRSEKYCLKTANSHQSIKDSRIIWLGDSNRVLTTGFDAQRLRQIIIRDVRNFNQVEKSVELDCSTGILMPLYDADTGMLFLAGKGDTTIGYMEVTDKDPYLIEGIRHSGEQTKGACLVPKRALNVMQGEVNRILQLTSSSVIPVTYQVPRKTYRDFHADLYPDTVGYKTELNAEKWLRGENFILPKISLNPADRANGDAPIIIYKGSLLNIKEEHDKISQTKKPGTYIQKPKATALHDSNDFAIKCKSNNLEKFKITNEPVEDNKDAPSCTGIEKEQEEDNEKEKRNVENKEIDEASKNEDKITIEKVFPPKPLPRASRTGSICESSDETNAPKPVARPRTNSCVPVVNSVNPIAPISGGYKPRLGPKPFTALKLNEAKSFDQVFCVPPVPTQNQTTNGCDNKSPSPENNSLEMEEKNKPIEPEIADEEPSSLKSTVESNDPPTKDDQTIESEGLSSKTPTTAERRRMFEASENEENLDSIDAKSFERGGSQRASIAERKKMYENKSISVIENATADKIASPVMLRRKGSFKTIKNKEEETNVNDIKRNLGITKQQSLDPQACRKSEAIAAPPKRTSTVFGRVSKFRHLKVTPAHKSQQIENVRNVSRQIPGECDGFHANPEFLAVPLSGPGGKISILNRKKPGKLPDGVIPSLVQGSNIMDFSWDPFDNHRLAVACDDGIIKLWRIEEDGLKESTNKSEQEFNAHSDKIYFIKFHPTAKDVLASGSYDMTIKIWDLSDCSEKIVLKGHTDQIFSFAWSPCGTFCSTVCKDGKIRVYNPRRSETPVKEGKGPEGNRGARIVWALEGQYLAVSGFDKVSQRLISVYKIDNLDNPLNTIVSDVSPSILIPFYDEDSSTLFVTGKGDSTIYAYEITEEAPHICPLSHHRCPSLHQGLSFLPKNTCDVAAVEFAVALRLTNNTIEPLSFTVPRIKTELFQDDLFPPTRVTWKPTTDSNEWFSGKDKLPQRISLQPEGMMALSGQKTGNTINEKAAEKNTINKSASSPFIAASRPINLWDQELSSQIKEKQNEIQKSISNRMEINLKLEQDEMEGVDEKEWD
ncbi:coronin-7 isoform X1 [Harmonia axyridis]|uniref:coronin-7 isoform X1 n=1 Tax=Harmonia axyridis TaxID=115357 RepID=UPI001E278AE8|nr:coronin-7 isoform X1 [Harmonia axyridis]